MEQEKLNEIIASHGRWLQYDGGKRADLAGDNLHGADLAGADLYAADLEGTDLGRANLRGVNLQEAYLERANLLRANLEGANLYRANLEGANLCGTNLRGVNLQEAYLHKANLEGANLYGANLAGVNLEGTDLPTGMYQVVGAGSCNRCTTYDSINDQVICGCWNDGAGNHLDSFVRRIEEIYGTKGKEPDSKYYAEYMSAVAFFNAMKELK